MPRQGETPTPRGTKRPVPETPGLPKPSAPVSPGTALPAPAVASPKTSPPPAPEMPAVPSQSVPASPVPAPAVASPKKSPRAFIVRRSRTGQSFAAGSSAGPFDLDGAILDYARNGSQIHTDSEDAQPAYLVFVQQQGSATTPSATFQLRENLGNYLRATAAAPTDEEKATGNVPRSLTDLAPLLQSSQFSSCLCSAIQNPFSSCPPQTTRYLSRRPRCANSCGASAPAHHGTPCATLAEDLRGSRYA